MHADNSSSSSNNSNNNNNWALTPLTARKTRLNEKWVRSSTWRPHVYARLKWILSDVLSVGSRWVYREMTQQTCAQKSDYDAVSFPGWYSYASASELTCPAFAVAAAAAHFSCHLFCPYYTMISLVVACWTMSVHAHDAVPSYSCTYLPT